MSVATSGKGLRSPIEWGNGLGADPIIDLKVQGRMAALIRSWRDVNPAIEQPSLDHHYLSIHLGGAKRLHRTGEGKHLVTDVECGAYSVTPAGAQFSWNTEGPVDFMHIYMSPTDVDHFILDNFDRDPRSVSLTDTLGGSDLLVGCLASALGGELARDNGINRPFVDDIVHLLLFSILRLHSNAVLSSETGRHALAPYKLRHAIDFMQQHLAEPIGLANIAAAADTSPFHFSRTFRVATGKSPYAYLIQQRINAAIELMRSSDHSLAEIAKLTGFADAGQFSRIFRKTTGFTPREFRHRL